MTAAAAMSSSTAAHVRPSSRAAASHVASPKTAATRVAAAPEMTARVEGHVTSAAERSAVAHR
jgi:hypothetical protein